MYYPTLQVPGNLTAIEEFSSFYRITIDQSIPKFSDEFAFELRFTQENVYVIDYKISKKDGLVTFVNESRLGSGNVQVEYQRPSTALIPDSNFLKVENLACDASVHIAVDQLVNRVTLAEVNTLRIRFYNGEFGAAPSSVTFTLNGHIILVDNRYEVVTGYGGYGYGPACTYGYSYSYGYGYGPRTIGGGNQIVEFEVANPVKTDEALDTLEIDFKVSSPTMYVGEIRIFATSIPVESNSRVVVNNVEKFRSADAISSVSDEYEIVVQGDIVDFYCNNQLVDTERITLGSMRAMVGAQARTLNDKVTADFANFAAKQYYQGTTIPVNSVGRFVGIEASLRENP
jgi:hypothetical protein